MRPAVFQRSAAESLTGEMIVFVLSATLATIVPSALTTAGNAETNQVRIAEPCSSGIAALPVRRVTAEMPIEQRSES